MSLLSKRPEMNKQQTNKNGNQLLRVQTFSKRKGTLPLFKYISYAIVKSPSRQQCNGGRVGKEREGIARKGATTVGIKRRMYDQGSAISAGQQGKRNYLF